MNQSESSDGKLLSIVIPFLNEAATLAELVKRVQDAPLPPGWARELILVDDGSTDGSGELADRLAERWANVHVVHHERNRGKGAAVRSGYSHARGDVVIVQDADLEYDPRDYARILRAIERYDAATVYGSRILGHTGTRYRRYWLGGRLVTTINNLLFGATLTDQPTCYKAVRRSVLEALELEADGFEFCTELTCKLLNRGIRIREVPIRYYPRGFEEGKKIRPRDGLKAVWTMVKLLLFDRGGPINRPKRPRAPESCTK